MMSIKNMNHNPELTQVDDIFCLHSTMKTDQIHDANLDE